MPEWYSVRKIIATKSETHEFVSMFIVYDVVGLYGRLVVQISRSVGI